MYLLIVRILIYWCQEYSSQGLWRPSGLIWGLSFWPHYSGSSNGLVILETLEPLVSCWRKSHCKPALSCVTPSLLLHSAFFVPRTVSGGLEKAPRCCFHFREVVLPESVSLYFGGRWDVWERVRANDFPLGLKGSPPSRGCRRVYVETHSRGLKEWGVIALHFGRPSLLRGSRLRKYNTRRIVAHSAVLRHH